MALPASGQIDFSDINVELGLTATAQLSLGASNVRTLYGIGSGAIRLGADGYGKSNAVDPGAGVTTAGPPIFYDFGVNNQSFGAQNATLTASGSTYSTLNATGVDPYIRRTGLAITGFKYPYVEVYLLRTNGTTGWDGSFYYQTAGHGESELYKGLYTQPTWDGVNYQYMVVDMRSQIAGAPDWTDNTITGLRFDFGVSALDDFRIDWIQLRGTIYPVAGLYQYSKTGYHNEDPIFMDSGTTAVGAVSNISTTTVPVTTTYSYLGYFLPPTTGVYNFAINSDDGGYLWVGTNAVSGYTTANATVNYGGLHGAAAYQYSGNLQLTAGVYYPIRYIVGNNGGAGAAYLAFQGPGIALTTNGTGYFFYNADTTGI